MDTTSILLGIQKNLPYPYGKMGNMVFIELKNRLDSLSDTQRNDVNFNIQSSGAIRSALAMLILNALLGTLGVARFMIGDWVLGLIRLAYQIIVFAFVILAEDYGADSTIAVVSVFLMVGNWIWWGLDLYLVDKKVRMQNLRKVLLAIDSVKNQSK